MTEPPSDHLANHSVGANDPSTDLRRAMKLVRARLPVLIVAALLAAGAALLVSDKQPKIYEATATMIVGQSLSSNVLAYNDVLVSQRMASTYARLAASTPVLDRVVRTLGLTESSTDLAPRIQGKAATESTLVTVSAQDLDPTRAATIANAVAQELSASFPVVRGDETDVQRSVDEDLDATRVQIRETQNEVARLTSLSNRSSQQEQDLRSLQAQLISLRSTFSNLLPLSSENAANKISVIEPAIPPGSPVSPRPLINAMLAAFVAVLVVGGLSLLAHQLDDTVNDAEAVRAAGGLPTLASVPRITAPGASAEAPLRLDSRATQSYRQLRANLEFNLAQRPLLTLLVTSASPGEGKTVTAANLAIAFAEDGRRVLLVDTNLRRPGIHKLFNLPNRQGLTTLLLDDRTSHEVITHQVHPASLRVMTAGPIPPDPGQLLGSKRLRTAVELMRADYDLVVFDSPSLQTVVDAALLGSLVDATVLVVRTGHTRSEAIRQAREQLAMAGARVVGVVLNRVPRHSSLKGYEPDPQTPEWGANAGLERG